MPPYKPYASKAQARKLHAMANDGEIAKSEVAGKDKATDFKHLPERKSMKKPHGDIPGNTTYPVKMKPGPSDVGTADPLQDTINGLDPGYKGDASKGETPQQGTVLGPADPGSKVGNVEYTEVKTYKGKSPF
jgi:hypothetical protein